ncbi:MAG: M23 family metallopeptidase [Rhizobiaceae bacterium]|nr:M23 family metallopeptidase [Rhizobiaceae bacterium]
MKPLQPNPESQSLGELPAISGDHRNRKPDRRQVSIRWLASSILVGLTSLFLMGGALFATLDGREELTLPAVAYDKSFMGVSATGLLKGDRPGSSINVAPAVSNVMMVSTVSREGDSNVITVRPFMHIRAPLAIAPKANLKYPSFNALTIFSESSKSVLSAKSSDSIYGANVDSQVTTKITDFPFNDKSIAKQTKQNIADIEALVRKSAPGLVDGAILISTVSYFDDSRFSMEAPGFITTPGITIVAENVTTRAKLNPDEYMGKHYYERTVPIKSDAKLATILETEGMDEAEASIIANVLISDLASDSLKAKDSLLISFEANRLSDNETLTKIARISVYRAGTHLVSVARSDNDRFVYALKPDRLEIKTAVNSARPTVSRASLPSAYNGIYRAALSEGLTPDLAGILIKIFAFDVDFKSRITPTDDLSVFVSLEDGKDKPTAESEILFAALNLNGVKRRYYRFRDAKTDRIDYYDAEGKSAKKFLLRKPVPNGRFTSPFGMRYHPVARVRRLHGGVDWAAPRGTKILAAGNGVIEKAGWNGGNGRQTVIRHTNGYKTSYSHQSRIAKGIRPGIRVRQGQVIGSVGSTGLSTGPHLHYEVRVNGNKVNPMRIRLPNGRVLKNQELASFKLERDRIDALLKKRNQSLALLN